MTPPLPELLLPNGCVLVPGGRIRIPREQLGQIDNATAEALGLVLDDSAASPWSEVVVWPSVPAFSDEDVRRLKRAEIVLDDYRRGKEVSTALASNTIHDLVSALSRLAARALTKHDEKA